MASSGGCVSTTFEVKVRRQRLELAVERKRLGAIALAFRDSQEYFKVPGMLDSGAEVGVCPLKYFQTMSRIQQVEPVTINLLPHGRVTTSHKGFAKVAFQTQIHTPLVMIDVEFYLVDVNGWEEVLIGQDDLERYDLLPWQLAAHLIKKPARTLWSGLRVLTSKVVETQPPEDAMRAVMKREGIEETGGPEERAYNALRGKREKLANHNRTHDDPEYLEQEGRLIKNADLNQVGAPLEPVRAQMFFSKDWISGIARPLSYMQRLDVEKMLNQIPYNSTVALLEEPKQPEKLELTERFPLRAIPTQCLGHQRPAKLHARETHLSCRNLRVL